LSSSVIIRSPAVQKRSNFPESHPVFNADRTIV
jgi:hypothetical protein